MFSQVLSQRYAEATVAVVQGRTGDCWGKQYFEPVAEIGSVVYTVQFSQT